MINASARLAVDGDKACARSELRTGASTVVIACMHAAKSVNARGNPVRPSQFRHQIVNDVVRVTPQFAKLNSHSIVLKLA